MKETISLTEFIEGVKKELFEAAQKGAGTPLFSLEDVELETEFSVEAEGSAGFKFVVDLQGRAMGSHTHRVKLRLRPIPPPENPLSKAGLEWVEDSQNEPTILVEKPSEKDPNGQMIEG